jgi:copper chaperone CopZ
MREKRSAAVPAWLIFVAIVVLGASAVGILFKGKQPAGFSASAKVTAKTKTVRIPVQGMTCAVCAANVRRALQSVAGVQEAEVDLERRQAWVRYDESKVSPDRLLAAIDRLGYKAGTPVPEAAR